MVKWLKKLLGRDTVSASKPINEEAISAAYRGIEKEIESLAQYDRGEKQIDARDLKATLRNVR